LSRSSRRHEPVGRNLPILVVLVYPENHFSQSKPAQYEEVF
jgi:hypothetical protein